MLAARSPPTPATVKVTFSIAKQKLHPQKQKMSTLEKDAEPLVKTPNIVEVLKPDTPNKPIKRLTYPKRNFHKTLNLKP